eukprot:CAMPEP_0177771456 /NCGR_PEP_ID=MMETSP0491_2-20121128/11602_1 /TAXON_ID=63592 /ORGANISM="Tetraselmis chuii, Strain PLY429" /LENGTH=1273 /DNA_ID=CAMNT_0019289007 /DNA_START=241 /DNA_END=4062 /DNA_ORIENTATION=-
MTAKVALYRRFYRNALPRRWIGGLLVLVAGLLDLETPCLQQSSSPGGRTTATSTASRFSFSTGLTAARGQSDGSQPPFNPDDGACGNVDPWTQGMCLSDGNTGGENGHCGPCLEGEAWDRLRAKLGTNEVRNSRSTVPTIKHAQWLSATLAGTVIHILLKELLGYDRIRVTTSSNHFDIEEAASESCRAINMETWFASSGSKTNTSLIVEATNAQPGRAIKGLTGGVGLEALFVPSYLPFSSTHYIPLQENIPEERNGTLARPLERFPPDGTFGIPQLNASFPSGEPWGCSDAAFNNGSTQRDVCDTGRWYPPQCNQGGYPSKECAELYIPVQSWSGGWFEAVTKNLGLNFSTVYTSSPSFREMLSEKYEKREGLMYYWWEPDPLHRKFPSRMVTFPRNSVKCVSKYHSDPSLSGVDCDQEAVPLHKLINAGLALSDPDILFLWDAAHFSNSDLDELMGFHVEGGGENPSMYGAACAWLQSNASESNWRSWLQIGEPCARRVPAQVWNSSSQSCDIVIDESSSESTNATADGSGGAHALELRAQIAISAAAAFAFVFAVVCTVTLMWKRSADALSSTTPPKLGESVTIVITDIQGSTSLWDTYPRQMAHDIALHHRCLRATLKEFRGYEVATEGDSFKCAFHAPEDAITWAICVQMDLLCAHWSPMIEDGGWSAFGDPSKWGDPSKLPEHSSNTAPARLSNQPRTFRAFIGDHTKPTRKPIFDVKYAASTLYSKLNCEKKPYGAVRHIDCDAPLPVFRGLRVRIGIHTGNVDVIGEHENTKRVTYGGQVMVTAKAISDVPAGGQIIASAETIAAISSMHTLEQQVRELCQGWIATKGGNGEQPAAMSVVHMGAHLLSGTNVSQARTVRPFKPNTPPPIAGGTSTRLETSEYFDVTENMLPDTLTRAQELVAIVPFALRARSACFPPLNTVQQLTPGFADAPAREGVTIVFTFIEKWAEVKAHAQMHTEFAPVLEATKAQVNGQVRAALLRTKGYEVEGEDGCFVIAFHSPNDAVEFGITLQQNLRKASLWMPELLALPACRQLCDDKGEVVVIGARVKIGMCTAEAQVSQPSMRTGRAEYFGWVMNHAARVAATANGGQVLLHECSHEALDLNRLRGDIVIKPHGTHRLKGIKSRVSIFEVCDKALQQHIFHGLQRVSEQDLVHVMGHINNLGKGSSRGRSVKRRPTRSRSSYTDLAILTTPNRASNVSHTSWGSSGMDLNSSEEDNSQEELLTRRNANASDIEAGRHVEREINEKACPSSPPLPGSTMSCDT